MHYWGIIRQFPCPLHCNSSAWSLYLSYISLAAKIIYFPILTGKYWKTVSPKATHIYWRPCKAAKYPVWPLGCTIHLIESRQAAWEGTGMSYRWRGVWDLGRGRGEMRRGEWVRERAGRGAQPAATVIDSAKPIVIQYHNLLLRLCYSIFIQVSQHF